MSGFLSFPRGVAVAAAVCDTSGAIGDFGGAPAIAPFVGTSSARCNAMCNLNLPDEHPPPARFRLMRIRISIWPFRPPMRQQCGRYLSASAIPKFASKLRRMREKFSTCIERGGGGGEASLGVHYNRFPKAMGRATTPRHKSVVPEKARARSGKEWAGIFTIG